nr:unnamed protein product [Spirometra erinaceieuropaei]
MKLHFANEKSICHVEINFLCHFAGLISHVSCVPLVVSSNTVYVGVRAYVTVFQAYPWLIFSVGIATLMCSVSIMVSFRVVTKNLRQKTHLPASSGDGKLGRSDLSKSSAQHFRCHSPLEASHSRCADLKPLDGTQLGHNCVPAESQMPMRHLDAPPLQPQPKPLAHHTSANATHVDWRPLELGPRAYKSGCHKCLMETTA